MKHNKQLTHLFLALVAIPVFALAQSTLAPENVKPQAPERPPMGRPMGGRGSDFKQFLNHLKQTDPKAYERLEQLRTTDRGAFFAELRKLMPARQVFPNRIMKLDRKCQLLSRQYHQARTEEEKALIKKEMEEAVQLATDAMITDMKERLKQMTERLDELEKNRDQAIQKRMEFLLMPPKNRQEGEGGQNDGSNTKNNE